MTDAQTEPQNPSTPIQPINPHLETNQHGMEPTTPQASSVPFTMAVFPRAVIPYHALIGNINDETIAAIEDKPKAFIAIVPYGGGKRLLEENPLLAKDIENFVKSFGYAKSENLKIAIPRARYPPSDDFGKPHTLLLMNPPNELATYLVYQQTFAFETSKEEGQKKIAFHALPFDKTVQTWIVTDITGNYVENNDYARMSALATIKTVLSRDPHGLGVPARVTGTGTHGYGYGSRLAYPWTRTLTRHQEGARAQFLYSNYYF